MIDWSSAPSPDPETEADYAALRTPGRTTVGKSFALRFGSRSDIGAPARTVWQVIGEVTETAATTEATEVVTLHKSSGGRVQVKARVVRDRGRITEMRLNA